MFIPIFVSSKKYSDRDWRVARNRFNIEFSRLVRRANEVDDWYYPSSILMWRRCFMPNTSKEKGRKIFFWRVMLNLGIIRINLKAHLPF